MFTIVNVKIFSSKVKSLSFNACRIPQGSAVYKLFLKFKIYKEIIKIFQPLFISMVILYFNGGIKRTEALIYAAVISVCVVIAGILHHPYFFNSWRIGMKIRIACSGLIYRKVISNNFCFK